MKNNAGAQAICVCVMFLIGLNATEAISIYAKQDAWICILLSALIFVPFALIYSRILSLYPEKGFYEILDVIFGRFAIAFKVIFTLFAFLTLATIIRQFTGFIVNVTALETSEIYLAILLSFVCAWAICRGEAVSRSSILLFSLVVFMSVAMFALELFKMDVSQLFPMLTTPPESILGNTIYLLAAPFAQQFLLVFFLSGMRGICHYRTYLVSLGIGTALLLLTFFGNVMVLGNELVSNIFAPTYIAASAIKVGSFLQRIETLSGFVLVICVFFRGYVCMDAVNKGVVSIFPKVDYKKLAYTMAILAVIASMILFKRRLDVTQFHKFYVYLSLPIQFALPILIWGRAEALRRR